MNQRLLGKRWFGRLLAGVGLLFWPFFCSAGKPSPRAVSLRTLLRLDHRLNRQISRLERSIRATKNQTAKKLAEKRLVSLHARRAPLVLQIGNRYRRTRNLRRMDHYFNAYARLVALRLKAEPTSSRNFYKTHPAERSAAFKAMEVLHLLAAAHRRGGNKAGAKGYDRRMIRFFDKFHLRAGPNAATARAAQAAFRATDADYNKFMAQRPQVWPIKLSSTIGGTAKQITAVMCELMGWGRRRGRICLGKGLPMVKKYVNAYEYKLNKLTGKFLNDVYGKYGHPASSISVHRRTARMYARAAANLRQLALPAEMHRFWQVFWPFVQRYRNNPRMRSAFTRLLQNYGINIRNQNLNMVVHAYRLRVYGPVFRKARALARMAARLRNWTP